jgi:DNA-binding IclR family transcriptional regulator
MQEVADYAGAVVALGTRDRLDLIYLELARSKHGAMLRLMQGSRLPIATTAMGRALIAGMPESERNWLLGYIKRQEGKNWPKVKAASSAPSRISRRAASRSRSENGSATSTRSACRWSRPTARACSRSTAARPRSISRARSSKATSGRGSSTWSAMSKWP